MKFPNYKCKNPRLSCLAQGRNAKSLNLKVSIKITFKVFVFQIFTLLLLFLEKSELSPLVNNWLSVDFLYIGNSKSSIHIETFFTNGEMDNPISHCDAFFSSFIFIDPVLLQVHTLNWVIILWNFWYHENGQLIFFQWLF